MAAKSKPVDTRERRGPRPRRPGRRHRGAPGDHRGRRRPRRGPRARSSRTTATAPRASSRSSSPRRSSDKEHECPSEPSGSCASRRDGDLDAQPRAAHRGAGSMAERVEAITLGARDRVERRGPRRVRRERRCTTSASWHGALPGVPVAAAIAGAHRDRGRAGRDPHPDELRRPRRRRSALGAPRPARAHERDRAARATAASSPSTPSSAEPSPSTRGSPSEGPGIFVVRAKSFAAEPSGGAPATVTAIARGARHGRHGDRAIIAPATRRSEPGRRSTRRRSWSRAGEDSARPRAYAMIEELATLLHGAAGASRAIVDAGLGAVLAPGRPDRQDGEARRCTSRAGSRVRPSTSSA